ncbi:MAG: alpha/beta hydrolase [Sporocytophaga sp.]|uniref:alpha/beta fold hydrolase n=1 Tax=Sporocytophaga sp. TaxID=2231183 RepID=UPI001B033EB1|nr:alpha/beta hydrolase [Sporocytophaga sp.]MBO9702902.1 alpha/beta hydrolase [Sporocytophaga sp.]
MKHLAVYIIGIVLLLISCSVRKNETNEGASSKIASVDSIIPKTGYSEVNGLKMYYEIYGEGEPLVLIHGGGSTIQTTFGQVIPELSKHRKLIGVELQAHGRTSDRNTDLTFEQDADDTAMLLKNLGIPKADFLGFSNGGMTTLQLAIRHPQLVNRIIVASALYKRSGAPPEFWEFMKKATLDYMPQQYKDAYVKVSSNPQGLQNMHDKCAKRMAEFKDWKEEQLKSITAKTLLIIGDTDVMTPEHAVEMYRLIPNCQLAIVPGGHGKYIGEITTIKDQGHRVPLAIPMIEEFLDEK